MKFNELGLKNATLKALDSLNITTLTDIQEKSIPVALSGKNLIGQARTGSGKTFAFSIPIVEKINPGRFAQALIIVPTRELCKQVAEVITDLVKFDKRLRVVQVYGGVSIQNQINKIKRGVEIIVATPGRLIDLYDRGTISFDKIKFVVLDEADRMLDMGFFPDIQYIMSKITNTPQYMMFSATLIQDIKNLCKQFTGDQVEDINVSEDSMTVNSTSQFYYLIHSFQDKYYDFVRIIRKEKPTHSLVFTNTKKTADWLKGRLDNEKGLDLKIDLLSGNMSQYAREKVTEQFKSQQINFLIATDVAARGLDIPDVTHVINYDVPKFEENYVHRIGRTSRMDTNGEQQKEGIALTLCLEEEYIYLCRIEGYIDKSIKKRELPTRKSNQSSYQFAKKPRNNQYRRTSNSYADRNGNRNNSRSSYKNRNSKRDGEKEKPVRKLPFF